MKKLILICLLTLTVSACSKAIPDDKLSYTGEWSSPEMYLLILPDGTVSYERLKNGGSTSIDAPLTKFIGDDFVVGFAFFTTTFNVTEVPHEIDEQWFMTVDGVELIKTQY